MRSPFRKAAWWMLAACLGAAMVAAAAALDRREEEYVVLPLGILGMTMVPVGVVMGISAALSGLGAWRLARGAGVMARWQVAPADWDRFRTFDTRRAGEPGAHANDYTPRPAEGRPVEVLFGRRQVIVDGSYHPLGRWSVPSLMGLGWLQPPDAPETIEFDIVYPRGRHGGTIPMAIRVPVPRAARADAVRVFQHFKARVPKPRVGLAYRRPRLVIGWGLGVTGAALLAAGIGWIMQLGGDQSLAAMVLLLGGLLSAIGAAFFTAVIVLATAPWKGRAP